MQPVYPSLMNFPLEVLSEHILPQLSIPTAGIFGRTCHLIHNLMTPSVLCKIFSRYVPHFEDTKHIEHIKKQYILYSNIKKGVFASEEVDFNLPIEFSGQTHILCTAPEDQIRFWDKIKGQYTETIPISEFEIKRFVMNDTHLAFVDSNDNVEIWDRQAKVRKKLPLVSSQMDPIVCLLLHNNFLFLITDDTRIVIWDMYSKSCTKICTLTPKRLNPNMLDFDGEKLYYIWNEKVRSLNFNAPDRTVLLDIAQKFDFGFFSDADHRIRLMPKRIKNAVFREYRPLVAVGPDWKKVSEKILKKKLQDGFNDKEMATAICNYLAKRSPSALNSSRISSGKCDPN